jgi:hypothetical protein
MAITIRQEPTSPNQGNNNLLYVVTSNTSSSPQYQFVCDIKDENDTLIQRIKQQPNPSAKGVFDIGQLIPNQLGPTDEAWKTTTPQTNSFSGGDFKVFFGEQYGLTTTDTPILYNGAGSAGNPAVTGSDYYFLLDGLANPNDLVDWNWNSGSKYAEEDATDDVTFSYQFGLTNFDTSSVQAGDYGTLSFLRGNALGGANDSTNAMDVFAATYRQYSADGTLLDTDILYDTFTGLRTTSTQTWDQVYTSQSEATRLVHYPAGPQNLEDVGVPVLSNTAYYTITFNAQATDRLPNQDGVWGEYRYNIVDPNCGYDGARFAFKNEYGVWDYYNFTLAEGVTSNVERQEYKQTFVDYSTTSNSVAYDKSRRGRNNYYNKITKNKTANTNFLNQTDADNLREMFFSTDVYIQSGSEFLPVVINNASVVEKTNPRSQKLFRYEVQYQLANEIRVRR